MKSSGIGGQAVLEGVMMRNKSDYAVAVRKPDGEIAVTRGKCKSLSDRSLFFRLPIIRGIVAFFESLVIGMRTMAYSASFYEEEEKQQEQKKEEQRIEKSKREEQEEEEATGQETEEERKEEKKKEEQETGGQEKKPGEEDWKESVATGITIAFSVVLAVAVFVVLPYVLSQLFSSKIKSPVALAAAEGLIRVALFISYVIAISFMEDIRRTFMYHGAEHKTINCIENGLELTVENARGQSKHHRRCGTSFLVIVLFLSILFFMFIHFDNLWLRLLSRVVLVPAIAGISYEFIHFAGNSDSKLVGLLSKPGMLLQKLTTREPDDGMLQVAIASVEEIFDWKEYQRRCIAAQKSKLRQRQNRQMASGKRKTRAEIAQEIKQREEENAKRANERARQLMEQEYKEAELERVANEAVERKSRREALQKEQVDKPDDALAGLDHYFDDEKK